MRERKLRPASRRMSLLQPSSGFGAVATSLLCLSVLFTLRVTHDLQTILLVYYCGDWLARMGCCSLILPSFAGVAMYRLLLQGRGSTWLWQGLSWLSVAIGFLDMSYATSLTASRMLRWDSTTVTLSDSDILLKVATVAMVSSWLPCFALGMLFCSMTGESINKWVQEILIKSSILGLVLLLPVHSLPTAWPECSMHLGGIVLGCTFAIILAPKKIQKILVPGIIPIIAYSASQYLRCRHCGNVELPHGFEDRPGINTIWSCHLEKGGILEIVQGHPKVDNANLQLKGMRLGHSIMGGVWISPAEFAGIPIYSIFQAQAAGALFLPQGKEAQSQRNASLHIGLGIGSSIGILGRLGFRTDVIEIHPEIVKAARTHFNLTIHGSKYYGDASKLIRQHDMGPYDLIILDIFSGDVENTLVNSKVFYPHLSRVLVEEGVLAVNYFGFQDSQLDRLYTHLTSFFKGVRCFREEENADIISNYVCFCSNSAVIGTINLEQAVLHERFQHAFGPMASSLGSFFAQEVSLPRKTYDDQNFFADIITSRITRLRELSRSAAAQWRSFRDQFG